MNKSNSSKTLLIIIIVCFFSGSIPVYASSILGPDTLNSINNKLYKYLPDFYTDLNETGQDEVQKNKEVVSQYINSSIDQVIVNANNYRSQEEDRITEEVNDYAYALIREMKPVFEEQEARLKQLIKELADDQIELSKERLLSEVNSELQNRSLDSDN